MCDDRKVASRSLNSIVRPFAESREIPHGKTYIIKGKTNMKMVPNPSTFRIWADYIKSHPRLVQEYINLCFEFRLHCVIKLDKLLEKKLVKKAIVEGNRTQMLKNSN